MCRCHHSIPCHPQPYPCVLLPHIPKYDIRSQFRLRARGINGSRKFLYYPSRPRFSLFRINDLLLIVCSLNPPPSAIPPLPPPFWLQSLPSLASQTLQPPSFAKRYPRTTGVPNHQFVSCSSLSLPHTHSSQTQKTLTTSERRLQS